ncbi:MAG: ECF transporter S component [Candidatus Cloacimonetes bacterium]|nr:ECF transporter S component [Candidatus Cloacimonadota bacterium]
MSFLRKFSSQDLLYLAILSAVGLAVKPIITPLIHLVSAPLMIPGGSLAGGLYMMWIALAISIVNKPGAGTLVGLTQGIVMISMGFFGSHGAVSIISYTLPGLTADIISIFFKNKSTLYFHVILVITANITGAVIVTLVIMRLAAIPFLISIIAAIISGIVGGIISYNIFNKIKSYNLI